MDVTKLNELAELRVQERTIKAKIDAILPQLSEEANELEQGTELEVSVGRFVVSKRRTWSYPDYVTEKKAEFDAVKEKAEQTGDATYVEKASLIFKENKE